MQSGDETPGIRIRLRMQTSIRYRVYRRFRKLGVLSHSLDA